MRQTSALTRNYPVLLSGNNPGISDLTGTHSAGENWRDRNPGCAIAWRIDERARQTEPPEPLIMNSVAGQQGDGL